MNDNYTGNPYLNPGAPPPPYTGDGNPYMPAGAPPSYTGGGNPYLPIGAPPPPYTGALPGGGPPFPLIEEEGAGGLAITGCVLGAVGSMGIFFSIFDQIMHGSGAVGALIYSVIPVVGLVLGIFSFRKKKGNIPGTVGVSLSVVALVYIIYCLIFGPALDMQAVEEGLRWFLRL